MMDKAKEKMMMEKMKGRTMQAIPTIWAKVPTVGVGGSLQSMFPRCSFFLRVSRKDIIIGKSNKAGE